MVYRWTSSYSPPTAREQKGGLVQYDRLKRRGRICIVNQCERHHDLETLGQDRPEAESARRWGKQDHVHLLWVRELRVGRVGIPLEVVVATLRTLLRSRVGVVLTDAPGRAELINNVGIGDALSWPVGGGCAKMGPMSVW